MTEQPPEQVDRWVSNIEREFLNYRPGRIIETGDPSGFACRCPFCGLARWVSRWWR